MVHHCVPRLVRFVGGEDLDIVFMSVCLCRWQSGLNVASGIIDVVACASPFLCNSQAGAMNPMQGKGRHNRKLAHTGSNFFTSS